MGSLTKISHAQFLKEMMNYFRLFGGSIVVFGSHGQNVTRASQHLTGVNSPGAGEKEEEIKSYTVDNSDCIYKMKEDLFYLINL